MLKRILWLCVAFPVAALLVTLAVANRHSVRLVLDPFRPETPVLSIVLPFYGYLFGALLIGVLLGGTATWLSQSRWRRTARTRSYFTVYQGTQALPLQCVIAGRYHDRFEKVDGAWRFCDRLILGDLQGNLSQHLRDNPLDQGLRDQRPLDRKGSDGKPLDAGSGS